MKIKWLKEVTHALSLRGIRVISCEQGKKHVRLTITNGKTNRFLFTALSPSDHRAINNVIRSARKTLADIRAR